MRTSHAVNSVPDSGRPLAAQAGSPAPASEGSPGRGPELTAARERAPRIAIFGHFGMVNFGNESTLQALLGQIRLRSPNVQVTCICTDPAITSAEYLIETIPIKGIVFKPSWLKQNAAARFLRKMIVGIPSELYRWWHAVRTLAGRDAMIVAGTGLLTDAYGFTPWGPYNLFRWSLAAKLCRCKVLFISVGAGPLYRPASRRLVKAALGLADYRSYRDPRSRDYLAQIGAPVGADAVYPDLAFSLPELGVRQSGLRRSRMVVGVGLMEYAGRLSIETPDDSVQTAYLDVLVRFVTWLAGRDVDVRLVIGDIADRPVVQEFKALLKSRTAAWVQERVIDEPIESVADVRSQLAATDIVVATRFHNILLSLREGKPVVGISFHHKCSTLMESMGLSEFCQDINHLDYDRLVSQFIKVEENASELMAAIQERLKQCRRDLDRQYEAVFDCLGV